MTCDNNNFYVKIKLNKCKAEAPESSRNRACFMEKVRFKGVNDISLLQ